MELTAPVDAALAGRLEAVRVDPSNPGDPGEAWLRLHARFGRRATLVDRYALEAAARGVTVEQLGKEERAQLVREVLGVQSPGLEFLPASARGSERVEVVAYRDSWREEFARWRRRLIAAFAQPPVRLEHIGSTAVPGLPAKPTVDVQISVRDVEDEEAYVPAIEAVGLSLRFREPGHRYCRPAEDRRRTIHVHVCESDGTWEREHLLFRDYLRADARTRAAYAGLKQELADRYADDRLAYTDGKTEFVLDALEEAEAWAGRTGWTLPAPLR